MNRISSHLDCLGILHLHKISKNVEIFTTSLKGINLSRNKLYYESKLLKEISKMRKQLLSYLCSDKFTNYIILDYAINFSAQVYYFLLSINAELDLTRQALNCLQEDVNNIVNLIESKNNFTTKYTLPQSDLFINFRNIELDNKLEIYAYVKSFGKCNFTFISPGLGSILIGSFFKAVWGNEYKHILYSRFKNKDNLNITMPNNLDGNLYLIDDNIGSGFTTQELMLLLKNHNLIGVSAVEYDWFLFDIISKGLSHYTKFNYTLYDKLDLINTRNHKFLDQAIDILKNNPKDYCKYLKQNNFNQKLHNDFSILIRTGKRIVKQFLPSKVYKNSLFFTKQILKFYKGV